MIEPPISGSISEHERKKPPAIQAGDFLLDRRSSPAIRLEVVAVTEGGVGVIDPNQQDLDKATRFLSHATALAWKTDEMGLYEQDMWEAD